MATEATTAAFCGLEEVLLDGYAYIGNEPNHTTAVDFTRNMERIVASFWSERPPLLSRLYVYSPDLDSSAFSEPPRILCVVEGLILFRVAIRCRLPGCILMEECDYFIYHVDSACLEGIPNPSPVSLRDDYVGLLPRDNGGYTLFRGIAFIKEKRCLRFVDLDIIYKCLPDKGKKSGYPSFRFDGWTVITWNNCKLTNSFEDWKMDCLPAHGDIIKFDAQMQKRLLKYQLLRPKSAQDKDNSVAADTGRNLWNLLVFLPTPSMDNSDVVFLIAKTEFLHPESYVFAIDTRKKHLQDVTEFGIERELCDHFICHHGSVSKDKVCPATSSRITEGYLGVVPMDNLVDPYEEAEASFMRYGSVDQMLTKQRSCGLSFWVNFSADHM
ncbi:hypothetical protein C2845_PM13G15250 [Panicum miliaceum]|uniref:DUF1618 domain-containing protein n=1 Tax=Panicum miliaceum TaxID=4540 RepID=A0A3L6RN53_PANMI|nr:hypothetical protein C2845_PM13G15250 [Panicum miliaceum]